MFNRLKNYVETLVNDLLDPLKESRLERDQCPQELVKDVEGLIRSVVSTPRLLDRTEAS